MSVGKSALWVLASAALVGSTSVGLTSATAQQVRRRIRRLPAASRSRCTA